MGLITLSMIVKNEEATLATCLRSIKDWVDEIRIVDTGSTDGTIDIAKSFNAEVRHFDWCDDFSAARNYSLSLVSTPWTLWLDADDLVLNPEVIAASCEYARKRRVNSIWSTYLQDATCQQRRLQIFKTKDYRWEGFVHENPIPKQSSLAQHDFSELKILHRKPRERAPEAAQKYLDILLAKDPGNYLGIAESYKLLGDKVNAEMYYTKAAFHPKANDATRYVALFKAAQYCMAIAVDEQSPELLKQASQMVEIAHKLQPHRAEAIVLAGQLAEALNMPNVAREFYQDAIKLPKPTNEIGVFFHDYYGPLPAQLLSALGQ